MPVHHIWVEQTHPHAFGWKSFNRVAELTHLTDFNNGARSLVGDCFGDGRLEAWGHVARSQCQDDYGRVGSMDLVAPGDSSLKLGLWTTQTKTNYNYT
jgi:hypothetical protein